MERTRRDVLGLAGLSLSALAAGCLESPGDVTPTANGTGTPTGTATPDTGTPTDTPTLPDDLARVDEPPYEIDQPDCGDPADDDSDRDPLYLCANMDTEPSLSFTQAASRGSIFADEGLTFSEDTTDDQLYATLLTEAEDTDRLAADSDGEPAALVRETNFDSHAVLVVQTGWGSGSVYPHVERIEETEGGVHAFGCHSDPCIYTDDYTMRTAAVRFDRPETLDSAVVSLTVAVDERWNVAAGEGVVTLR